MRISVTIVLVVMVTLSLPILAADLECYLKTGTVRLKSGEKLTKGADIPTCAGTATDAVVCFTNNLDQHICRTTNGSFDYRDGATSKGQSSMSLLWAALFSSDPVEFYGGKRLKDAAYLPGFPYGEVLRPEEALVFSSRAETQRSLRSFELYAHADRHAPVFRDESVKRAIRIPAAQLRYGEKYRWVATSSHTRYEGQFSVAREEDQRDFENELRQAYAQSSDISESGRQIVRAALAKDYAYTFDLQQSMSAARSSLAKGD